MKRSVQFVLLIHLIVSPICVYAQASGGPVTTQTPTNNGVSQSSPAKCLPAEIKLSDVVDATNAGYANGQPVGLHKVTVEQKLNELKATCNSDNKLIDGN